MAKIHFTPYQWRIIAKLRQGYKLNKSNWNIAQWWLSNDDPGSNQRVKCNSAEILLNAGVVQLKAKSDSIHNPDIYEFVKTYFDGKKTEPGAPAAVRTAANGVCS